MFCILVLELFAVLGRNLFLTLTVLPAGMACGCKRDISCGVCPAIHDVRALCLGAFTLYRGDGGDS